MALPQPGGRSGSRLRFCVCVCVSIFLFFLSFLTPLALQCLLFYFILDFVVLLCQGITTASPRNFPFINPPTLFVFCDASGFLGLNESESYCIDHCICRSLDHKIRCYISIRTTYSLDCHRHQLHCTALHYTLSLSLLLSFFFSSITHSPPLHCSWWTFLPKSTIYSHFFRCLVLSQPLSSTGVSKKEPTSFRSRVYRTWMPSSYIHYQATISHARLPA
jgi:hypothetical protein